MSEREITLDTLREVLVEENGWGEQDRGAEVVFRCLGGGRVTFPRTTPSRRDVAAARKEMAICGMRHFGKVGQVPHHPAGLDAARSAHPPRTIAQPAERPILFSSEMVKAILDDRKTQTRRLIVPQPDEDGLCRRIAGEGPWLDTSERIYACPYGKPGDRLWVRETLKRRDGGAWCYAADEQTVTLPEGDPRVPEMIAWAHHKEGSTCVSIHIPRWASRITLSVTETRVQRLHDITEDDARAEGLSVSMRATEPGRDPHRGACMHCGQRREQHVGSAHSCRGISGGWGFDARTYRGGFAHLWDCINGKRAPWSSNPWVWAVSFARVL